PPLSLDPPYGTIYAFAPRLRLPYTSQWSASVEQPLGARQTLSVSYVGAAGRRLLRQTALLNPNPTFTLIRLLTSGSASDYHALQAVYARRLARGLQAHASYTWSHSIDNDSDDSANGLVFTGSFDPRNERGPSTFDVRHSFSAAASFDLPRPRRGARAASSRSPSTLVCNCAPSSSTSSTTRTSATPSATSRAASSASARRRSRAASARAASTAASARSTRSAARARYSSRCGSISKKLF